MKYLIPLLLIANTAVGQESPLKADDAVYTNDDYQLGLFLKYRPYLQECMDRDGKVVGLCGLIRLDADQKVYDYDYVLLRKLEQAKDGDE